MCVCVSGWVDEPTCVCDSVSVCVYSSMKVPARAIGRAKTMPGVLSEEETEGSAKKVL